MATWVLIIFAHVGALVPGNSNALTTAEFTSKARCEAAGNSAKKLASGSVKNIDFRCVEK